MREVAPCEPLRTFKMLAEPACRSARYALKLLHVTLRFISLNSAWLKALNISSRSCNLRALSPPSGKFLNSDRSVTLMPGLLRKLRGYAPLAAKASYTLSHRLPRTTLFFSPTLRRFRRPGYD